ncbi:MAG: tetratricopeptide repeat protein [Candidatus Eisenbacteria bacterium]|uniref:Tetratricopeptide repeat protein n=1 Tax=Eiseniibacteriota bacterium TaxID=2212470 RepID=A0A956M1N5_UNCEI|nr:tetratricopeptide repeat protein [Candidatus Eisenbacteria bacterium]
MPSNRAQHGRRGCRVLALGLAMALIGSTGAVADEGRSPAVDWKSPEARSVFPPTISTPASADSISAASWTAFLRAGLDHAAGRVDEAVVQLRKAGVEQPAVRLELADLFYEAGEIDSALVHAEIAAAGLPDASEPCVILGRSHLARGHLDEGIEWFSEARRRNSNDPGILMTLLNALQRAGRFEEALALLEPAIPENVANGSLYATRAALRLRAGRQLDAVEDLAVAVAKDPGAPALMQGLLQEIGRLPTPDSAIPVLERLIAQEPDLVPPQRALIAILATSPQWKDAVPLLQRLIMRDPADARSRVQLGLLLARGGDNDLAEQEWIKATRNAPDDTEAWRWLCRSAARSENWERLGDRSDSLRTKAPEDVEAWWFTGLAAFQRDDGGAAEVALRKVLELEPDHREACLLLSSLLVAEGKGDEAEGILRRFVELNPRDVGALYQWGVALERTGRFDESVRAFDRLLAIEPRHDAALNYVGYMCIERGVKLDEALARVERALQLDPDNAAYLDSVGWGYRVVGRTREAVAPLERAVAMVEDNATILKHLGIVYQELGRTDDAVRVLRRARKADPADQDIQSRLAALEP